MYPLAMCIDVGSNYILGGGERSIHCDRGDLRYIVAVSKLEGTLQCWHSKSHSVPINSLDRSMLWYVWPCVDATETSSTCICTPSWSRHVKPLTVLAFCQTPPLNTHTPHIYTQVVIVSWQLATSHRILCAKLNLGNSIQNHPSTQFIAQTHTHRPHIYMHPYLPTHIHTHIGSFAPVSWCPQSVDHRRPQSSQPLSDTPGSYHHATTTTGITPEINSPREPRKYDRIFLDNVVGWVWVSFICV